MGQDVFRAPRPPMRPGVPTDPYAHAASTPRPDVYGPRTPTSEGFPPHTAIDIKPTDSGFNQPRAGAYTCHVVNEGDQ